MTTPEQKQWHVERSPDAGWCVTDREEPGASAEHYFYMAYEGTADDLAALLNADHKLAQVAAEWLRWATDLAVVNWTLSEEYHASVPKMVEDTIALLRKEWDDPAVSKTAALAQVAGELAAEARELRDALLSGFIVPPSAPIYARVGKVIAHYESLIGEGGNG